MNRNIRIAVERKLAQVVKTGDVLSLDAIYYGTLEDLSILELGVR